MLSDTKKLESLRLMKKELNYDLKKLFDEMNFKHHDEMNLVIKKIQNLLISKKNLKKLTQVNGETFYQKYDYEKTTKTNKKNRR